MVRWTRLLTKTKPEENEEHNYLAKNAKTAKKKKLNFPCVSFALFAREMSSPALSTQALNHPIGDDVFGPEGGFERVGAGDEADVTAPFGDQRG